MAQGPHPCMEQPSGCPSDSRNPKQNSSLPVCNSSLIFVLVVIHFLPITCSPNMNFFSPLHQSHVVCLSSCFSLLVCSACLYLCNFGCAGSLLFQVGFLYLLLLLLSHFSRV